MTAYQDKGHIDIRIDQGYIAPPTEDKAAKLVLLKHLDGIAPHESHESHDYLWLCRKDDSYAISAMIAA